MKKNRRSMNLKESAKALRRKHFINESRLDSFVVDGNTNIVCIQCLFKQLLSGTQLNVLADQIGKSIRNNLDFEMYYQVDGATMRQLLSTTILTTNVKNGIIEQNKTIAGILSKFEPFAAYLTDASGERIAAAQLSSKSENILKQRNAQRANFSVFRFSFIAREYDVAWTTLYANKDDNHIYAPGTYIMSMKSGKFRGIKLMDASETFIDKKDLKLVTPYVMSGYWNKVNYDPDTDTFEADPSLSIKTEIPALLAAYDNDPVVMFYDSVKSAVDVDDSQLGDLLSNAASKAFATHNDLRTISTPAPRRQFTRVHKGSEFRGQLPYKLSEDDEDTKDALSAAKKQIPDAKKIGKEIDTPSKAKDFLSDFNRKIQSISKKLKGKDKDNFKKLVDALKKYSEEDNLDEASSKKSKMTVGIICAIAGVVAWLCNLNSVMWIAFSPFIGPFLEDCMKKITGLK